MLEHMNRVVQNRSAEDWRKAMAESRNGRKPTMVAFVAKWCGPCSRVDPILDSLSNSYTEVTFLKLDVDVDELLTIATECRVEVVPTLIGYVNGEQVGTVIGANEARIRDLATKIASK